MWDTDITAPDWTTGTTWSLRKHAIRPGAVFFADPYNPYVLTAPAACNETYHLYLDSDDNKRFPGHVLDKRDAAPMCKRCEKLLRDAGSEIAGPLVFPWASDVPSGSWFEQANPTDGQQFSWVRIPNSRNYIRFDRITSELEIKDSSQVNFWSPFILVKEQ